MLVLRLCNRPQGIAGSFVRRIDGCFFNVVGFPIHRFSSELVALLQQGKV
jgi:septum formation protein